MGPRLPASLGLGALIAASIVAAGCFNGRRTPAVETAPAAAPSTPPMLLDEAQREHLWQIEHHGLLLAKKGFSRFITDLSQADRPALQNLLASNFIARVPVGYREVRANTDYADVVRQRDRGAGRQVVSTSQFVEQLLSYRAFFTKPPRTGFALMSFHPVVDADLKGKWEGTGQFRLVGETGKGQLGEVVLYMQFQVDEPTKPTLRAGRWIHSLEMEQAQTARTLHGPLLREVASERGIRVDRLHDNWRNPNKPPTIVTGGVYLTDFDRDGRLDMLVTDVNGIALYKGLADGKFRDVTAEIGLPTTWADRFHNLAAWIDIDGDGWDDLILDGRIYRNDEGKRFFDVTALSNFQVPADATGIVVADFDRDGRLDFYVTRPGVGKSDSWLSGKAGDKMKTNQLWRNRGNWQFENVTTRAGVGGDNRSTFSAVWFDADNDGWPDLYVINEFGNGILYRNRHDGTFEARELANGPVDFGSMGLTAGDIDNDGNIDLYLGNMYSKAGNRVIGNLKSGIYPDDITAKIRTYVTGSQLWRNCGNLQFQPQAQQLQVNAVGWSYGPALVDLDNDGYLDIYATCGFISHSRNEPDG